MNWRRECFSSMNICVLSVNDVVLQSHIHILYLEGEGCNWCMCMVVYRGECVTCSVSVRLTC